MPTRHMISLAAVLIAVTYAAVSQGNGPAYLPAYALVSMMLVSWIHNRANVRELEISTSREVHGFSGAVVLVPFRIQNRGKKARVGLRVSSSIGGLATIGKVEDLVDGTVSISGLKRGVYRVESLSIRSIFPLGVFEATRKHAVECECAIYPEPIGEREIPRGKGAGTPEKTGVRIAGDDFAGVRNYKVGESQRHIDWKAVARGQPLMVKQFESVTQNEIWLDATTISSLDLEVQLSQMARWIMQSERLGLRYGLKIGGARVLPGCGNTHFHECLRSLAAIPGKVVAA